MRVISRLLFPLLMWITFTCQGQELLQVELLEDDIFLLDAKVEKHHVGSSIDSYIFNDRLLIAIEPLFDGLKLKYKIINQQIKIWKDNEEITINFNPKPYSALSTEVPLDQAIGIWADDGYYQFIELALIAKIFGVSVESDLTTQIVRIFTEKNNSYFQKELSRIEDADGYLFPIQKLAILNKQRRNDRYNYSSTNDNVEKQTITIKDQYRAFTPPHGRIVLSADVDDKRFNGSMQLVSDLLYHSTNLTMSQSDGGDFAASISFNRYKESPDDRILGLFDSYSLGDVSGVSNNLITSANAGVGIVLNRNPENYRRKNLETTIDEIAPPNWDADLFHNGRFLSRTLVPADGRLIYENVEIFYGLNSFEIKLYGPYGEEEVITKTITVKQNPLAKGQLAYSLNALDKNHNVINDKNNSDSFGITNYGGSINYGVSERWQIGATFASIDNEQRLFSIKNNLSFNNFLFENDFSFEQAGGYAQLTSITGSLFEGDNYSFEFESADNFKSEVIDAKNNHFYQYSASYALPTDWMYTNFSASYYTDDLNDTQSFSNTLSKNIGGLSLTHRLTYSKFKNTTSASKDQLSGTLGLNGSFSSLSLSGQINYDPRADEPILKSSSLTARKRIKDPYDNNHYIEAKYFPLNDKKRLWQLRHNVAWQSDDYQLTFSSGYNANDEWDLQFGIQFFLGYDYHHNSFIMDKVLSPSSATLDVHSYLDRQANGEPDVLDYNLPNVKFTGSARWDDLKSGEDGRTILPGVTPNSEFAFAARWQEGSATLNNDYVVYTHPGAYVDVNMPFFLVTDLSGFVVRQQQEEDIGLINVTMQLLNSEGEILKSVETDEDGYFEFLQLMPDNYTVEISPEYLSQKGLTGKVTETNISTGGRGGFVELPAFILRRMNVENDFDDQNSSTFVINEENVDALVWSSDEEVNKNYFTLPSKGEVKAKHSLTQPPTLAEGSQQKSTTKIENVPLIEQHNQGVSKSEVFGISSVITKIEGSKTLLPTLKVKRLEPEKIAPSSDTASENDIVASNMKPGWVIQFVANESVINKSAAINEYSAIGTLFLAEKTTRNNRLLNCVISRSFLSKAEAITALNKTTLKGWVTTSKVYSNIDQIN